MRHLSTSFLYKIMWPWSKKLSVQDKQDIEIALLKKEYDEAVLQALKIIYKLLEDQNDRQSEG